jgi:H+-transporting ATPase
MDVLCADKTGTLTLNQLQVTAIRAVDGTSEKHVLALAAVASSEGGQDPVDQAIREAAARANGPATLRQISFLPFDPSTKRSEATYAEAGVTQRVVKGAFATVSQLVRAAAADSAAAQSLESQGFRVLAVAAGAPAALEFIGLIALSDPPCADSAAFIRELTSLGVRTVMVTGDAAETARIVAHQIGLESSVCPVGADLSNVGSQQFAIFAGVLPEDKYRIVKAFQAEKHVVGMCGDGANDAPALRQAHLGIAVSSATDIAKAAAGIVLTTPGLAGIVATVKQGRLIFQRILTYTINSITKKTAQVLFLSIGLAMTGHAILTPLLMVMLMIIGDFLGMSLTSDRVRASARPNVWDIRSLTLAGLMMGAAELAFCASLFAVGDFHLHLPLASLQTLAFVLIVFGNQATTYNNRERRHLWSSWPSRWVMIASAADVFAACVLAVVGIGMQPLPLVLVLGVLAAATLFAFALDYLKVPVFKRLQIV